MEVGRKAGTCGWAGALQVQHVSMVDSNGHAPERSSGMSMASLKWSWKLGSQCELNKEVVVASLKRKDFISL